MFSVAIQFPPILYHYGGMTPCCPGARLWMERVQFPEHWIPMLRSRRILQTVRPSRRGSETGGAGDHRGDVRASTGSRLASNPGAKVASACEGAALLASLV